MKGISKDFKITILLTIIGYCFLLRLFDIIQWGDYLSQYEWICLFSFIFLIFIYLFKAFFWVKKENAYTAVHALYGSLLGEKIILVLWLPRTLILAEWIWIGIGIIGVLLHYLPEEKKEDLKLQGDVN